MKKPLLAFILSFFLPGAGLAYLGLWKWALVNFLAILAIGFLLTFMPENIVEPYINYIAVGLAGASGALARACAVKGNLHIRAESTVN